MRREDERAIRLADDDSVLARFHGAGVLGLADVHTALALGRIGGETDPEVLLAAGLAVRALRGGSVCVDLATVAEAVFEADEQAVSTATLPWPEPGQWLQRVAASPLTSDAASDDGAEPLRLVGSTLYLERYWDEEETVRRQLQQRRSDDDGPTVDLVRLRSGLDRVFSPDRLAADEPDRQRIAAAVAVLGRVTVLAGGPGTGKTTTVAKLLALLADQPGGDRARVALAAPTGKAAARLAEAVSEATDTLPAEDAARVGRWQARTLHRLLGTIPDRRGRFRHHAGNRLPYEVIVVDEMSMVSLTMMARLLEAVRPDARLVLVGDPDQLTSVEAGAVMADITNAALRQPLDSARGTESRPSNDPTTRPSSDPTTRPSSEVETPTPLDSARGTESQPSNPTTRPSNDPTTRPSSEVETLADDGRGLPLPDDIRNGVVRLTHTWRFGGAISELATAIRTGDAEAACSIVAAGHDDVRLVEVSEDVLHADRLEEIRARVIDSATAMTAAAEAGDAAGAVTALDAHRLLCAHRTGPYGVNRWTREVEGWLDQADLPHARPGSDPWYPGRPILVMSNDYELNLFNGDTGVVVATDRGLRAVFARGTEWVSYAPARLEQVQTVHAMTVHRGQGSQFTEVSFLLPPEDSPLLTRELVYTAVTRATDRVTVVGTLAALRRAVERPANRASGLRHRL